MTIFFRLLNDADKNAGLKGRIDLLNQSLPEENSYLVEPDEFFNVPGAPFAYWVSKQIRSSFICAELFGDAGRQAQRALSTNDDFRYLRLWYERKKDIALTRPASGWLPFAKGGEYSPFYADIHLLVNWIDEGREIEADAIQKFPYLKGNASWVMHRECNYLKPGLTWPLRTTSELGMRLLPAGCIFGHKGPGAFVPGDAPEDLLALQAVTSSIAFRYLVGLQLAAADSAARSYEVGVIQKTPLPRFNSSVKSSLARLASEAWSLKRDLDSVNETSHVYILPEVMLSRFVDFKPQSTALRLNEIQQKIDNICFELYEFSSLDKKSAIQQTERQSAVDSILQPDADVIQASDVNINDALLSWVVGVAFGRFDWRLATGERPIPLLGEPFEALPEKSPGMLQWGDSVFHENQGVLVDDQGQEDDLPTLIDSVLKRLRVEITLDVRRWLAKEFFGSHLKMYSKSRRQAPIYWPLQTSYGSYTLWVYYHRLNEQTLYTCVNDYVEPKLTLVEQDLNSLRSKSARSNQEEKELEKLSDLAVELCDFRDELLRIAKFWKPNLNDGVQIIAAPLWKLFQHKAWQKKLKETWESLEQGEYDWAHLACSIWPDRVLRKCHEDRSLAIAHDVEDHFWHEVEVPVTRGKKATGETKLEWQPKDLTEPEILNLIKRIKEEKRL